MPHTPTVPEPIEIKEDGVFWRKQIVEKLNEVIDYLSTQEEEKERKGKPIDDESRIPGWSYAPEKMEDRAEEKDTVECLECGSELTSETNFKCICNPSHKENIKKLLGTYANIDYDRNSSHYHCWHQNQPPACGIPLAEHSQCCLCDTQYSMIHGSSLHTSSPKEKEWEKEFENTKFAKGGGLAFECSDYEGMYVELKDFIKKTLTTEREKVREKMRKLDVTVFTEYTGEFYEKKDVLDVLDHREG